jgi:hypothetical protein
MDSDKKNLKKSLQESLTKAYPDPEKVIALKPETLGHHILHVLHLTNEPNKRQDVAEHLASHYHPDFQHDVKHAVEKALGWLVEQTLLGATPYDQDLLYVTTHGKETAEGYQPEHPSSIG